MSLPLSAIILAQQFVDRFREMGSGLRGERARVDVTDLIWLLAIVVVVVGFLIILSRALAKEDRRAKYNSPKALFRSLCVAHELKRSERRLLKQMARERGLHHPAQVFLEPAWFESQNLSASLHSRAPQLADVARRIFAEAPPEEVASHAGDIDAIIDA